MGRDGDAAALTEWLASVVHIYASHILPLDERAAHHTGLLVDRARAGQLDAGFADLAIGGIATMHGMTLLTRNLRHFAPLGVPAHDPYASLPG
jgi:predicted nucleic acid-binding protein